jgi:hypothetical protein
MNRSLNDIFVHSFLPHLLEKPSNTRKKAKKRFENWLRLGTPCAKLVESFGSGILLLLPRDLSNKKLVIVQQDCFDTLIPLLT